MSPHHPLSRVTAWCVLATAVTVEAANKQTAPPNPADAEATVPATRYQSQSGYRPLPPATTTADQNWQALNRTVAEYDPMSPTKDDAAAHRGHTPEQATWSTVSQSAHAGHHHGHSPAVHDGHGKEGKH